ncbi:MAG: hypothetical protein ACOY0S_00185, partial [Patescibacteria group bacterium]
DEAPWYARLMAWGGRTAVPILNRALGTPEWKAENRAQGIYSALDDQTRQAYLTSIAQSPGYRQWLTENRDQRPEDKQPEDYLLLQLTTAVANEHNFLSSGNMRPDNTYQFYDQVMRGELNAVSATEAVQNLNWQEKATLNLFNFFNAVSGGGATEMNQKVNPQIEEAQNQWAAEMELRDIRYNNPELYRDLNLDDPANRQAVKDQYAAALYIEDHARNRDIVGTNALFATDPTWLRRAALTGQIDILALKGQVEPEVQLDTLYRTGDARISVASGEEREAARQQSAAAIVDAYLSTIDPTTRSVLDAQLAQNRPDLRPQDYDKYRREQLLAMVGKSSEDIQLIMAGGSQELPTMDKVLSGQANYVGAAQAVEQTRQIKTWGFIPSGAIALWLNRAENGMLVKGQLLRTDPNATTWDKFRGSVMMTARPVTWTLMLAGPGVQWVSLGYKALSVPMMLDLGGTLLGMQFTADSLTQTMDVCSFKADMDSEACAVSAGMTAFAALSTIPGANQLRILSREAKALRATARLESLVMAGADDAAINAARAAAERKAVQAAAAQTSWFTRAVNNPITHRATSALGTLVFGAQAADVCSQEGASANCVITAGLAAVSAARTFVNPQIAGDIRTPVGRTIRTADQIVNTALAAEACLAAARGEGSQEQCTTAAFMAVMAFRKPHEPGRPQERFQNEPIQLRDQALADLRNLRAAADGTKITLGGQEFTVNSTNRPQLLERAKALVRESIISAGLVEAEARVAVRARLGGDEKSWTLAERTLAEAQKAWREISQKSAATPQELDAAQQALIQAKRAVAAESVLQSSPRNVFQKIADWTSGLLGKPKPEVTKYYEALAEFNKLRGQDVAPEVYREKYQALANLREDLLALSYNRVQKAYF